MHSESCLTLCNPLDCSPPGSSVHGFPSQEYWSGLPFLLQGIFLTQGLNPRLVHWQVDSFTTEPPGNFKYSEKEGNQNTSPFYAMKNVLS